jgi:putative FmdB family regulatory protein
VPTYEYRCLECDASFEQRRRIVDAGAGVQCPAGHGSVRRVFSVFAAARAGGSSEPMPAGGGGACCGGGCGCG